MKIYTKIVWQWTHDGELSTCEQESFDYHGTISWCSKGKGSSQPATPDYAGAAREQGAANKEAAIATAQLSNPNVTTPYGSQRVEYRNDPTTGNPVPYITQSLSPEQQGLLSQYNAVDTQLGKLASQGLEYVKGTLDKPFDQSKLPAAAVNPGQTFSEAAFSRLEPKLKQSRQELDADLANKGITIGSEAYDNAKRQQSESENDLYQQIAANSLQADQAARQNAIQEESFFRNEPLNTLNAVRSSAQIQNPQFQGYQGAQVQAAPVFQAAQQQGSSDIGLYNAQQAEANSRQQGTQGLISLGLGAAAIF